MLPTTAGTFARQATASARLFTRSATTASRRAVSPKCQQECSRLQQWTHSRSYASSTSTVTSPSSFRSSAMPPLPNVKSRTPLFIVLGVLGVGFWAGSLAVAANHQRQGTSIVRGTLFNVKFDTKAQELLGDNIDFTNPSWPWIYGQVAHLKGRVDIEFQVKGDKAEGRVHFVAIRPQKQWITTDFTLTMPDGKSVVVGEHTVLPELS